MKIYESDIQYLTVRRYPTTYWGNAPLLSLAYFFSVPDIRPALSLLSLRPPQKPVHVQPSLRSPGRNTLPRSLWAPPTPH